MATNVNFEAWSNDRVVNGQGQTGKVTATISLNDVVVNTSPNSTGGFNTATVTADKQLQIFIDDTTAKANGIPSGWYQSVNGSGAGNLFRRMN